ncbi:hypothetical protein F5Y16DRAFT_368953 [Xylariaceae sp. FL0255]|nr:hypothetical protein F5Y16DRAFT_368953 [Xylariaceae sp. FL0255]
MSSSKLRAARRAFLALIAVACGPAARPILLGSQEGFGTVSSSEDWIKAGPSSKSSLRKPRYLREDMMDRRMDGWFVDLVACLVACFLAVGKFKCNEKREQEK